MKVIGLVGIYVVFLFLHLGLNSDGGETAGVLYLLGATAGLGAILWAGWKDSKIWYGVFALVLVSIPLWMFFVEHQH
jgi:hypothetical protein